MWIILFTELVVSFHAHTASSTGVRLFLSLSTQCVRILDVWIVTPRYSRLRVPSFIEGYSLKKLRLEYMAALKKPESLPAGRRDG